MWTYLCGQRSEQIKLDCLDPAALATFDPDQKLINRVAACHWPQRWSRRNQSMDRKIYFPGRLGSCWIGLAEDFLNSPAGHDLLKLTADDHVVAPIVVG